MTIGNRLKRFLALILCVFILSGTYAPTSKAEDDFLLQLFLLALLEEYGLTDIYDLMMLMGVDSLDDLYDLYDEDYYGYDDDYYGDSDAAYYDNDGYPIYLDIESEFYYGLYTDDSAYIVGYAGKSQQKLTIPSYVDGYPVYDVSPYAFENLSGVDKVVISEGIERIDENAFSGCDLKTLMLPESLLSIEYNAFADCLSLKEITFAEGLDYIGVNAFAGCTNLRNVILPDSVTEIDYDAFFDCNALESVYIGRNLKYMSGNVFSNADIKNFSISKDNRVFCIEDGVLYNTAINSIVRYPGLSRKDTEFTVPDGITAVEYACFGDSNTLKRLIMPDSVKTIDEYAFYGCEQCEFFGLGSGLTTLGDMAIPTNQLRGIQLPSSLTSIQDLSLFIWKDEPSAYDELWIVAYDGCPAAEWAKEQGYTVYPPSEGALVAIGALEEKNGVLTVDQYISLFGETITLDLQATGYGSGSVRFIIEGEEVATAELTENTASCSFIPAKEGVYTVSALMGLETIAYAQIAVSGDGPLTIQKIPEHCYHEYAHIAMPDYVEIKYRDDGLEDEHIKSEVTHEAWVCSRCKAYCIEEGAIKTNSGLVPHELTLSGYCPCGKRITEGVFPVNEVSIKDGILPTAVWCYTLSECAWYNTKEGEAAGALAANTPVQVMGFDSGYVLTAIPSKVSVTNISPAFLTGNVRTELPDKEEIVYIPAGYLALLPLENPAQYGYHKALTPDKMRLSQLPSQEAVYEYYQDVRLWDNYLHDVSSYENSQFDYQTLRYELLNELYRNYDETLLALGGVDMLIDFEAILELDIVDQFRHYDRSVHRSMPAMDSLKAFADALGYVDYLKEYNKATGMIDKLIKVRNVFSDKHTFYKEMTDEQKEAFEEFFDDIDDLPIIDTVDDFFESLLKRIAGTKAWEKFKPWLRGGAKITDEVADYIDMVLPVFDVIFVGALLEDFFSHLAPEQKAALKVLAENQNDPYIATIAQYALSTDLLHDYFIDAMVAMVGGKVEDALIKKTFIGRAYKLYQSVFNLFMIGTVDTATETYNTELVRYMAYETARIGVSSVLSERLGNMPNQPNASQLTELEALVNEYVRLSKIAHPNRNSTFAKLANEEITRCRLYDHAPSAMPEKPILFIYQP